MNRNVALRRTRSGLPGLALAAAASLAGAAAPPAEIAIPGTGIFPESLTSTRDGSVIIGSIGTRQIFRAKPGAASAEPWILPGTDGMAGIFGVFADDRSGTLYACSNSFGPPPAPGSPPPAPATLYTFDLKSGQPKGHYPFPKGGLCNDIAVGPDGTAYATDTINMEVVSLKKGATALTVWAGDSAFGGKGGGLDGIAVLGSRVLAGTLNTSKIFSVRIQADGSAGQSTEVTLDHPIERPDGIRSVGPDALLVVEGGGGGRLSKVTLSGDSATVTAVKTGYPDGPVAVTVVGKTAYVLEGQLGAMMRRPGTPAPDPKPFKATAVEVGKPSSGL
jgi:hypothetical protein